MISVFIDPTIHDRQLPVLVPAPIQSARSCPAHPLDREILATLENADGPVGTWQLLNSVARAARPASRAEIRSVRQQALARINPLLRSGLVRRIGRGVLALP